jgi:spherulation-specific family 4 protein
VSRAVLVVGLLSIGAGLLASVVLGRTPDRSRCAPSLIPAYLRPDALVALADAAPGPRLLIVNPASGPGERPDADYRRAIGHAQANGARVLGYVATTFGARHSAAVLADAEHYRAWYGIDGIFLDEVAHGEPELPYYAALSRRLRDRGELVLNPGMVPAPGYFDLADVVVTYEGPFADYAPRLAQAPGWVREIPEDRTAHLVYAASLAQARSIFSSTPPGVHLYVTSGTQPDPWGSPPPPYLREEAERRSQACP